MFQPFKKTETYYDILKITPDTTNQAVKESYMTQTLAIERDKNPRNKTSNLVKKRLLDEAFATLRTIEGRNRYNRLLLTSRCKPKGITLKADNDNKTSNNSSSGLLNTLGAILKGRPQQLPRPIETFKERDHG